MFNMFSEVNERKVKVGRRDKEVTYSGLEFPLQKGFLIQTLITKRKK
jgi:hypothetical protein